MNIQDIKAVIAKYPKATATQLKNGNWQVRATEVKSSKVIGTGPTESAAWTKAAKPLRSLLIKKPEDHPKIKAGKAKIIEGYAVELNEDGVSITRMRDGKICPNLEDARQMLLMPNPVKIQIEKWIQEKTNQPKGSAE